jgi:catechol 2,3 dioxygenase
MSTAVPQSETATVEYVEVTTPRVHNLHHVEILTPQIEASLDFFTRILGLVETGREGASVYLKGFGEWGAHSTVLTESDRPGLGHMGWQVAEPGQVEGWARRLQAGGHEIERVAGGTERCQGDAIRFRTPAGHAMELFYDFERCSPLQPSRLLNQPERYLPAGIGVRRLDHINLTAADVDAMRDWLAGELGFNLREAARNPDGTDIGVWMSVTSQVHDIACMTDALGERGRLHHVGFSVDTPEGILRAADMFAEEGIVFDAGPGKHGLTQAFFVYVFEPGGNRIELFSGGYAIHGPDWQPVIWKGEDIARAIVWYGAPLPESFFTVAT